MGKVKELVTAFEQTMDGIDIIESNLDAVLIDEDKDTIDNFKNQIGTCKSIINNLQNYITQKEQGAFQICDCTVMDIIKGNSCRKCGGNAES